MKRTLLELTQDIMSDMSDDEVNSIDDSFESQQVAQIIQSTYLAMMSNRNWPHLRKLVSLYPYSNQSYPTHMRLSSEVKELCFVNYNVSKDDTKLLYQPMSWLEPDDFLRMCNQRDSSRDTTDTVIDITGVQLLIENNRAPKYYTSFDDEILVFDSYDKTVDSTLQESKTQTMAYIMPLWSHLDDAIPDLPAEAFAALLNEAKSAAMLRLAQRQDAKAETEARRQQSWLSRKAWQAHGGIKYPNYGRRGKK